MTEIEIREAVAELFAAIAREDEPATKALGAKLVAQVLVDLHGIAEAAKNGA